MSHHPSEDAGWRTSSYSTETSGMCVEVLLGNHQQVHIRDTKCRSIGHIDASGGAWRPFLASVCRKDGHL
jgi:hypothetical protein